MRHFCAKNVYFVECRNVSESRAQVLCTAFGAQSAQIKNDLSPSLFLYVFPSFWSSRLVSAKWMNESKQTKIPEWDEVVRQRPRAKLFEYIHFWPSKFQGGFRRKLFGMCSSVASHPIRRLPIMRLNGFMDRGYTYLAARGFHRRETERA